MKTEIKDGMLIITIPVSENAIRSARPSATGKTRIGDALAVWERHAAQGAGS